MLASRPFDSSPHCCPSPDAKLVAALSVNKISIRSAESLEIIRVVELASAVTAPILAFSWSPSSSRILVATREQLQVVSVSEGAFYADIRVPISGGGKALAVTFGGSDDEILAFSTHGLKVVLFDLERSTGVEVNNPKFYQSSSAARGFSFRPRTGHLALLTRTAGKDVISLHDPVTRLEETSWYPDLIDVQGIQWTEDGCWILAWETPAQGHKLHLFTPDGQLFRSIGPPSLSLGPDAQFETGIRLCQTSPNAEHCVIGDGSRAMQILQTRTWTQNMKLCHQNSVTPTETLQIWQEEINQSFQAEPTRSFCRATRVVTPEATSQNTKSVSELQFGASLAVFDASSTLLATKLEESPSTVWIWDLQAAELRAVLLFHSAVTCTWHPSQRELLLITCLDEGHRSTCFVWDPSLQGPTPINTQEYLPRAESATKNSIQWLNTATPIDPAIFFSNSHHYALLSIGDSEEGEILWKEAVQSSDRSWLLGGTADSHGRLEDTRNVSTLLAEDSLVDDTFSFKREAP